MHLRKRGVGIKKLAFYARCPETRLHSNEFANNELRTAFPWHKCICSSTLFNFVNCTNRETVYTRMQLTCTPVKPPLAPWPSRAWKTRVLSLCLPTMVVRRRTCAAIRLSPTQTARRQLPWATSRNSKWSLFHSITLSISVWYVIYSLNLWSWSSVFQFYFLVRASHCVNW